MNRLAYTARPVITFEANLVRAQSQEVAKVLLRELADDIGL